MCTVRRVFISTAIILGATILAGCGSSEARVRIESNTAANEVRDLDSQKRPNCENNDFTISGIVWGGEKNISLRLLEPIGESTPSVTTASAAGDFSVTATAIAGVDAIFGLIQGRDKLVARIHVQGLIEKDCSLLGI